MRLSEDELNDIRLHYPSDSEDEWTVTQIAEWIGCAGQTVINNAIRMGLTKDSVHQNAESLERKRKKEAEWRRNNKPRVSEYMKGRYRNNRDTILADRKERYRNDPEYRARKKRDSANFNQKKKQLKLQNL